MSFFNNKYTCFDPAITTNNATVYYTDDSYKMPYTAEFRVKGNYSTLYQKAAELFKLIFDGGSCTQVIPLDAAVVTDLEEISFENSSIAFWNSTYKIFGGSTNSSVTDVKFKSVASGWKFDTHAELEDKLTGVENIEVYQGWDKDLACMSTNLTAQSISNIIDKLATVTGTHTISFANIAQVPAAKIAEAVAKGWTVS